MQLALHPLSAADSEPMLDILTSKVVSKTYMLPDFPSRSDALPLCHRLITLSQDKDRYVRGIYLEDALIGFVNDVAFFDTGLELGYVIHPAYHGKGHMTRALRLAITELFQMGYDTILCGAFEENPASIRVMEKAGMHRIEKIDQIDYRGMIHRCVYYSIQKRR